MPFGTNFDGSQSASSPSSSGSVSLTTTGTSGAATLVGSALNVPDYTPTNGYILNGVANFTQSTNPSTRIGGGALVVGDRLYRTDLRMSFFWSGVTWLCEKQELEIGQTGQGFLGERTTSGLAYISNLYNGVDFNIFFEKIILRGGVGLTHNATDNWSIAVEVSAVVGGVTLTTVNTWTNFAWTASGSISQFAEMPLNTLFVTNGINDLRFTVTRNGAATTLRFQTLTLIYRLGAK